VEIAIPLVSIIANLFAPQASGKDSIFGFSTT